jgi:predicted ATP-dependent serine protease
MEGHVGISQVLATIRQKFWVLQGPAAVKRVVGECLTCQRWNSRPESQIMAPLPDARVTPAQPPFSSVGIDY